MHFDTLIPNISSDLQNYKKKYLLGKPRNDFQGHGPSKASERLQNFEIFWNFDFGFWICVYALCGVKKVLTFILKILTVYSLEAFEKWHWFYYGHIFRIFFLKILQIRCDIWNQCIKMHLNCPWSVTLKTNWKYLNFGVTLVPQRLDLVGPTRKELSMTLTLTSDDKIVFTFSTERVQTYRLSFAASRYLFSVRR